MLKLIVHWLLVALSISLTAYLVPGVYIENYATALVAAVILGILNVLVWPILAILTLPITVLTLGLFLFVVNALVLKFGAALVPGFAIEGLWPAILGSTVLTIAGWLIKLVFDEDKGPSRTTYMD